ncbi:MAG: hypothetical protein HQK88_13205 [Nitrospirae bacterium]|nr:hypothetical protein [Nitrospirota bacterium]MBF0535909.1 hypothetical protein [Nitrospirota bacterium]MBF0617759.1 hypothetical protein [Nitrospirota bacterium]
MVLRIKTPLGGVYFNEEYTHPLCYIKVIDGNGHISEETLEKCEYPYPHKLISTCKSYNDIKKKKQELLDKGKDSADLPDSFKQLNGVYNYWTNNDLTTALFESAFEKEDYATIKKHKISCYGFICYTTDIWDKINDERLNLRKKNKILRGGLQIATKNMPQGELIEISLARYTYLKDLTLVIVHFDDTVPDLGRKGFQPELVQIAQKISAQIINLFAKIKRSNLKESTGAAVSISAEKEIYDWIKEQEEHANKHPLVIKREDVFLPTKNPSLTSEPLVEQDVIVLFSQLLAGGVIRGIKLMATSQYKQYDGIYKVFITNPFEHHIYDKSKNPLGIDKTSIRDELESKPKIIEYKYSFDGLIDDFDSNEKEQKDVDLVVAWAMGSKWKHRYSITSLLHFDNVQHRQFHGATHLIKTLSTRDKAFTAIILSELIAYINDPNGVQQFHNGEYSD